jgi:hypothetical protein
MTSIPFFGHPDVFQPSPASNSHQSGVGCHNPVGAPRLYPPKGTNWKATPNQNKIRPARTPQVSSSSRADENAAMFYWPHNTAQHLVETHAFGTGALRCRPSPAQTLQTMPANGKVESLKLVIYVQWPYMTNGRVYCHSTRQYSLQPD